MMDNSDFFAFVPRETFYVNIIEYGFCPYANVMKSVLNALLLVM